jgi:hypothetical protein
MTLHIQEAFFGAFLNRIFPFLQYMIEFTRYEICYNSPLLPKSHNLQLPLSPIPHLLISENPPWPIFQRINLVLKIIDNELGEYLEHRSPMLNQTSPIPATRHPQEALTLLLRPQLNNRQGLLQPGLPRQERPQQYPPLSTSD